MLLINNVKIYIFYYYNNNGNIQNSITFHNLLCVFTFIVFIFSHEHVFDQAYCKYKCCHLYSWQGENEWCISKDNLNHPLCI